jgi:hypothetical protein
MSNTGKSPYSTEIAKSSLDFDMNPMSQMLQYQREEQEAKAPLILPFEMAELPRLLADMVDSGFNSAKIMENVLKSENFKGDLKKLNKLKRNVEKMVVYLVKNVDPTMVTFTTSFKNQSSVDK